MLLVHMCVVEDECSPGRSISGCLIWVYERPKAKHCLLVMALILGGSMPQPILMRLPYSRHNWVNGGREELETVLWRPSVHTMGHVSIRMDRPDESKSPQTYSQPPVTITTTYLLPAQCEQYSEAPSLPVQFLENQCLCSC